MQLNCYEYDILGIYSTIRVCHLQASCIFMSWIKGFSASPCQPPTKNFQIQMVKCSLFMEKKGSDGNHTLDETIILLLVSCHSHHSEGRMETCTPLFNFSPTIFHPLCPIFQLAISVISAAIMRSDTGARKPLYGGAFVMGAKVELQ